MSAEVRLGLTKQETPDRAGAAWRP